MKKKLTEILNTFGYPVFPRGAMNDEEYFPESFFTFWNYETPEGGHYDNDATNASWTFWVYFFSEDPDLVDSVPEELVKLLKQNGWTVGGKGEDVTSALLSHAGRMITCRYLEIY